ncbi:hypothetical protein SNE40_001324 [Patella caerulea]|uniref:Uncharacterized protein n=1 Tax=Patella caerulea TaxID=87958 RepID=A0AAN8QHX8_PATCE
MLSAILVAAILCNHGYAKNIPKRRNTRDVDLSRALEILQQQRDRLQEEDYRRLAENGINLEALGLYDDNLDESPLWLSESLQNEEPEESFGEDDGLTSKEKDVEETSTEELDNIFDDTEPQKEKIIKTEEIIQEKSPEEVLDDDDSDDEKLSDDEYQALLRAVEKLQKHNGGNINNLEVLKRRTPKDVVKVSKEELNDVFDESSKDDSDNEGNETNQPDVLKRSPTKPEKIEETLPLDEYWLLNNYLNYDDTRKKRFTPQQLEPQQEDIMDEEFVDNKVDTEKAQLIAEIRRLQLVAHLEDLENEALTEALNQATQSQIQGTVSPKEFKSLEKAIKVEEALQALNPTDAQLALIVQEIARASLKRGEPVFKKASKRMDDGDLEDDYPNYRKRATKKRAPVRDNQGMWYDFAVKDKRAPIPPRQILEYLDKQREANSEDDEEEEDNLLPQILEDIPDRTALSTDTREDDVCPEVERYSDGCAFADYYGLPIDNEARELCNRYQICYTCGASFGLTSQWCDNTYRQIYGNLCDQNNECVIEAELFLRTMKLKQRFVNQQICLDECTAEYIGVV